MNRYLKLILLLILAVPLSAVMLVPMLVLNAYLGGINYELLIYHHRLDWGPEILVGSSMVLAVIFALAFSITVFIASIKKTKFLKSVLYFLGILVIEIIIFLLLRNTFIFNWL